MSAKGDIERYLAFVQNFFGAIPGVGWRTGRIASLPTCAEGLRGVEYRVEGAAGTADRYVRCEKDAADAYAWTEIGLAALYTPADNKFRVVGSSDATKKLAFEVDGFTTATTRTLTPPNFDGTIATLAGTETFTNKTLTAPTMADFTNAAHDHGDADDGGNIPSTSVTGLSWTYINTASPSAASTSSMDSLFSSTYDHYLITFRFSMSASNAAFNFRFRASSSDDSNANYANQSALISSGSQSITNNTGQTSGLFLPAGGVGITWSDIAGVLFIFNPQDTDETLWRGEMAARYSTPGASQNNPAGYFNNTTAFTGFDFIPASGNITGAWRVFGARDS